MTTSLLSARSRTPSFETVSPNGAQIIYDSVGHKTSETDQLGRTTTWKYDLSGNLIEVDQPQVPNPNNNNVLTTPVTTYTYDIYGDELTQTDAAGNTTNFYYDAQGRQTGQELPAIAGQPNAFDSTVYNSFGQIDHTVDYNGNVATYSYDSLGRTSQIVYGDPTGMKPGETVTYTYDALGRQQTVTDSSGLTTNTYDANGNLTEQQTPEGTIYYGYNALSQHVETSTAYTDVTYQYDSLGRLTTTSVNKLNGQTLSTPQITTDAYTADGAKAEEALPNGIATSYAYNTLNELTGLSSMQGNNVILTQQFALNADGSRKSVQETQLQPDGSTVTTDTSWTYDNLNRLTREAVTSSNSAGNYANIYTYDLVSNRQSEVHTGPAGGASETIRYAYDSRDELTSQSSSLHGSTTNSYDANGSLTTSTINGQTNTCAYDVRNKMTGATVNGVTSSDVYDDAGNRVNETVHGATTYYLTDYDNPTGYAQPIEERSTPSSTPTTTYITGDHVFAQAKSTGGLIYFITDGHGSTRALTNESGVVAKILNYDAYGTALNFAADAPPTIYLFGGDALWDSATSLYIHGDGTRGRLGGDFIERDDDGSNENSDPLTLRGRIYANDNPSSNADPTGHDTLTTIIVAAGLGAALGAGFNAVSNYALGTSGGYGRAALFGAVALPVSAFFPIVGIGLGVYGVYSAGGVTYTVFRNPLSTSGQKGAAIFLFAASIAGTLGAIENASGGNLWVNARLFTNAKSVSYPALISRFSTGQGFSGVYDASTGDVGLMPSSYDQPTPAGFVRAQGGGHRVVSSDLGGDPANHWGFAAILENDGALRLTWRSRSLNRTPDNLVPEEVRPAIIKAVADATEREVRGN